jgi:adenylate kinase
MRLILLGPAGAGKGTLTAELSGDYKIPSISTGDLFRKTAAEDTDLGRNIRAIMEKGDLVPDDITIRMVQKRFKKKDAVNGFILDGFPRTINQAEALAAITGIDKVLNLAISDGQIIRRLTGRRLCPKCGAVYHIEYMKPRESGRCDTCGGVLIRREDDTEEAIINRIKVYKEKTEPLIQYYHKAALLTDIDASGTPQEVLTEAREALEKK